MMGRDSHIDMIDEYRCRECLLYMLTSMTCVDINVGISINAKGGYCWIMLSLMPMV
jgi:hypothetical protein